MKLPHGDRATVDIRKLREYCLNPLHSRGRHKARVFAAFGIRSEDAEELMRVLLTAARESEAQPGAASAFGSRYTIDFDLTRTGRIVRIRSTWIIVDGQDLPRLTSCYVL